jgi:hypothetical protein
MSSLVGLSAAVSKLEASAAVPVARKVLLV